MQCFRSFHTAERTIEGVEAMHMMRKGQVKRLDGRDAAMWASDKMFHATFTACNGKLHKASADTAAHCC